MKNYIIICSLILFLSGCAKSTFEGQYPDPSKTPEATVEKLFVGVLQANKEEYMPWYNRYFVIESPTMGLYTQVFGRLNSENMYQIGSTIDTRWNRYYGMLRQYREFQRLYSLDDTIKKRIFMMAGTIFLYDQTLNMVDLYGAIPFHKAGYMRENQGDLNKSKPKYDSDEDVYIYILDELKKMSDEFITLTVDDNNRASFAKQDFINDGKIDLWQRYCNSLRLRALTRISDVSKYQARVKQEISDIFTNPAKYPVIETNEQNILVDARVPDLTSDKDKGNLQEGLETWGQSNIASKVMIDFVVATNDPRIPVLFGKNNAGEYVGLDQQLPSSVQSNLMRGEISTYDSTTFSRNKYFPGVLLTAAEVSFIKAEACSKTWISGDAQAAYNDGITKSVQFYYYLNSLSEWILIKPQMPSDISTYLNAEGVKWNSTTAMDLIAIQKWMHFGIVQMPLAWAEYRRLDKPTLIHYTPTGVRKTPPYRALYPAVEKTGNTENYNEVASKDNLDTHIFWDVN